MGRYYIVYVNGQEVACKKTGSGEDDIEHALAQKIAGSERLYCTFQFGTLASRILLLGFVFGRPVEVLSHAGEVYENLLCREISSEE